MTSPTGHPVPWRLMVIFCTERYSKVIASQVTPNEKGAEACIVASNNATSQLKSQNLKSFEARTKVLTSIPPSVGVIR